MRAGRTAGAVFGVIAMALAAPTLAGDNGVFADRIVFGQAAVLEGPTASLGLGMREGLLAAFGEVNRAGGVKGRKLELVSRDDGYEPKQVDRGDPQPSRRRQGVRARRAGRNADLGGDAADRDGGRRTLHRRLHRGRVPARAAQAGGGQRPGLLFPGNGDHGRAPDEGPRRQAHRDLLPGRRLRPGRARGRPAGARAPQDGARRRGHLRAQHRRGEAGAARYPPRQARRGDHGRGLQALRDLHPARPRARPRRDLRQHLLRRQRRARQGTRAGRGRGRGDAGRAVPGRPGDPRRCPLPGGAESARSRREARLRLARGLHGRAPRRGGAGEGRGRADPQGPPRGDRCGPELRPRRRQARLRRRRQPRHGRGLPDRARTDGAFKPVQTLARAGG